MCVCVGGGGVAKAGNKIKSQSKEIKAKVMIIFWEKVHYQNIQKVHR